MKLYDTKYLLVIYGMVVLCMLPSHQSFAAQGLCHALFKKWTSKLHNENLDALIVGERLVVREFVPSDLMGVHKYASDPEAVKYHAWGPNNLLQTKEFLNMAFAEQLQEKRVSFNLAVIDKNTYELIGAVSFVEKPGNEVFIGFSLSREFWGRGFGRESGNLIIKLAKQTFPNHKIMATTDSRNDRSVGALKSLGFAFVKTVDSDFFTKGEYRNTLHFQKIFE